MSTANINIECPICYDEIEQSKNCVTTECGHKFHCACLMQNSVVNGFACPMCRTAMAIKLSGDDDDDEDDYEDEEDEIVDEQFDDNVLTSFRMFHQQLEGEEVEEEQYDDEDEEIESIAEEVKPAADIIAAKLQEQGVTLIDFVKCMLVEHEEYEDNFQMYDRCSDQMFGKFRQIISNYQREIAEQAAVSANDSVSEISQEVLQVEPLSRQRSQRIYSNEE